jgi:hypothetical protein
MALNRKQIRPVDGLVSYVLEVKPYHTKILEVITEFVHEDKFVVNVKEDYHMCINLGYPNLNTFYDYPIDSINQGDKKITINADVRNIIFPGTHGFIAFSKLNDDRFTVIDVLFDSTTGKSTLVLNKPPASPIATGRFVHSFIDYCGKGMLLSTNAEREASMICAGGWGRIWDSFMEIVIQIDVAAGKITVAGDKAIELAGVANIQLIDIINGNVTSSVVASLAITNHVYDGVNTIITVQNDLSLFNLDANYTYHLSFKNIGWDESLCAETQDGLGETILVKIEETLDFSGSTVDPNAPQTGVQGFPMDINETLLVYNMENSASNDLTVGAGIIVSTTEPIVFTGLTPPPASALYTPWYDTATNQLKQFFPYGWTPVPYIYWYNGQAYHKRTIDSTGADSTWLGTDPTLEDSIKKDFVNGGLAMTPHLIRHNAKTVSVNGNKTTFTGGDHIEFLKQATMNAYTFGHDYLNKHYVSQVGIVEMTISTVSLVGDLTGLFVDGGKFDIDTGNNEGDYTVDSTNFDGTNTVITTVEPLSIPLNSLFGSIPLAVFDPTTDNTVIIPTVPMSSGTQIIEYVRGGPYQIHIKDGFEPESMEATFSDSGYLVDDMVFGNGGTAGGAGDNSEIGFSENFEIGGSGDITNFFQYPILQFDPVANTVKVDGNAQLNLIVGDEIRIIGATPGVNSGIFHVVTIITTGLETLITLDNPIVTQAPQSFFIEAANNLPMELRFIDKLTARFEESSDYIDGNGLPWVDAYDVNGYDIGGYDQNLDSLHSTHNHD